MSGGHLADSDKVSHSGAEATSVTFTSTLRASNTFSPSDAMAGPQLATGGPRCPESTPARRFLPEVDMGSPSFDLSTFISESLQLPSKAVRFQSHGDLDQEAKTYPRSPYPSSPISDSPSTQEFGSQAETPCIEQIQPPILKVSRAYTMILSPVLEEATPESAVFPNHDWMGYHEASGRASASA